MPQVPHPDECDSEVEHVMRMAAEPDLTEEGRTRLISYAKVRYIMAQFKGHGPLSTRHVRQGKCLRFPSSMPVTALMRDGGRFCIG